MAEICIFDAARLSDAATFEAHLKNVSEYRRKKISSLRYQSDKNLSLGAAIALDSLLCGVGLREKDMRYETNEYGKPYFADHPDIRFNLSHSGTLAVAVVSDKECGCDVEMLRNTDMRLAKRFFSKMELEYINSQSDKNAAFFRLWTLKESFVKACGKGLNIPLNEFCIHFDNGVWVEHGMDGKNFSFNEYKRDGYFIALCEMSRNGTAV